MEWLIVASGIGFLYLISTRINQCASSLKNIENLLQQTHDQNSRNSEILLSGLEKIARDLREVRQAASEYSSANSANCSSLEDF